MFAILRRALSWLPTLLVLAGLLALGLWGAAHDWKPSTMLAWLFPRPAAEKKPPEESDGNIRLASPDSAEHAGIEVGAARYQPPARFVEAHAVLAYDQTRYAQLSA